MPSNTIKPATTAAVFNRSFHSIPAMTAHARATIAKAPAIESKIPPILLNVFFSAFSDSFIKAAVTPVIVTITIDIAAAEASNLSQEYNASIDKAPAVTTSMPITSKRILVTLLTFLPFCTIPLFESSIRSSDSSTMSIIMPLRTAADKAKAPGSSDATPETIFNDRAINTIAAAIAAITF